MGRGILRGAGGDENLKSNFIWPNVRFFHLFVKLKCPDLPAPFKCQLTGEIWDTWAFFQINVAKQMIKE